MSKPKTRTDLERFRDHARRMAKSAPEDAASWTALADEADDHLRRDQSTDGELFGLHEVDPKVDAPLFDL